MPNPVYSAPFILYTNAAPNTSFIVPAGFTAVVRQISGYQTIGGWEMAVAFQNSEAAPSYVVAWLGQAGDFNYVAQEGRWVLGEGGIMDCGVSELGSTFSFYVGGYLLANSYTR